LAKSHPEKLRAMRDSMQQWESEMNKTAIPFSPTTRKNKPKEKTSK